MTDKRASAASDGYVLSWTYDHFDYDRGTLAFQTGERRRPPRLHQMWFETSRAAEQIKAEFLAAHPRGRASIEIGPKPKREATMFLGGTLTGEAVSMTMGEAGQ